MKRSLYPETGQAHREARNSLFSLLVGTVLFSLVIELGLNLIPVSELEGWGKWVLVGSIVLVGLIVLYFLVLWDDRRVQGDAIRIELLLPYIVRQGRRRVQVRIGTRKSYEVIKQAIEAWNSYWGPRTRLQKDDPTWYADRERGKTRSFKRRFAGFVIPENMALVRHLLLAYLSKYGDFTKPKSREHSFFRINIPLEKHTWDTLPPAAVDNPVSVAAHKAMPKTFVLPVHTQIEMFDRGEVLLRLKWKPHGVWWQRFACGLLGLLGHCPGGEVTVRWLGPLSMIREGDKPYDHFMTRLDDLRPDQEVCIVNTRMTVEIVTRWTALKSVGRFRDWANNLAWYLADELDYGRWRAYFGQRTVEDLDWKVGWIGRGEDPSLVERLTRLDERLARLEAHLWPDEPPSGESDGAWVSGE